MSSAHPSRLRAALAALGIGLSAGALLLLLGLGVLTIVVPAAVGGMPLSVLTGSMRPTYPPGTLVIIAPAAPEEIGVGDVITFQIDSGEPAVATHRVIERSIDSASGEIRFTTQGDANNTPDPETVRPVQIRGTVWYAVPYLGWVNQAIDGNTRSWAIPALAGALFVYAAWTIGAGLRSRAGSRRRRGSVARADRASRTGAMTAGAGPGRSVPGQRDERVACQGTPLT